MGSQLSQESEGKAPLAKVMEAAPPIETVAGSTSIHDEYCRASDTGT